MAPTCDLMSSPMIGRPASRKRPVPVVLAGDEHGQAVDEPDARLQRLLDVPLGRLLGADREVADQHIGLGVLEDPDHVVGRAGRLGDLLLQVLAEPVMGHAPMHRHSERRHLGELDRVVRARPDRLREVLADLLRVDVERGDELDVAHVIAAEVDVHQAGDLLGGIGVPVVGDALDEGVGAVADADDRDPDLAVVDPVAVGAGAVVSLLRVRCSSRAKSSSRRGRVPYYRASRLWVTPLPGR